MKRLVILVTSFLIVVGGYAQGRLSENVDYSISLTGATSTGDNAPFWFSVGRYGVQSVEPHSGVLRASLIRNLAADSLRRWRVGYGADVTAALNRYSCFNVQQAFVELQYLNARLSLGSKERPMELKNNELSSGGLTQSNNAVPIPQLRFELPGWWNISGRSHMVSIRGHIAYGMLTDGWWQENLDNSQARRYSKRSLYHSKAGFLRVGSESRFPLTFTAGLEMVCQFGGTAYNIQDRLGNDQVEFATKTKLSQGMKDFFHAFIPGGSDVNDGTYNNVGGNQLGSWHASLDWQGKNWKLRGYMEHFFEDHSQMFWQYAWKDMLVGVEAALPRNPIVSHAVVEFLNTMDQSGPIYHDITEQFPLGLYGKDNYYSHHIYGGYQHWGQNVGSPLLLSPIYNSDNSLSCKQSRARAYHAGLSGDPHPDVHWRLLYTHVRSLGTYEWPNPNPLVSSYFLAEIGYKPQQLKGLQFQLSLGANTGNLLSRSYGAMLTVSKSGILNKKVHK